MKSRQNVIIECEYQDLEDLRSPMDGRFHYFYRIVNPVNGKYYCGIHSTDDLFDGYAGSGSILKSVYHKYGKNTCVKHIEKFFNDRSSLLSYEKMIVSEHMLKDSSCYNIILGGGGYEICHTVPTTDGKSVPVEEFINSDFTHPTKGRVHINNGVQNKLVYPQQLDEFLKSGWVKGETHKSTKGKMLVNLNGEMERFIYPWEMHDYEAMGWKKGGKSRNLGQKSFAKDQIWVSKDNKQMRISEEDIDKYINEGWSRGICQSTTKGYVRITNGSSDKNIHPENKQELEWHLSNGWELGSCSKTTSKKIWISLGKDTIMINPNELDEYLKNGWVRGRKNICKS